VSFSPCERYLQCSGEDNKILIFDLRFPDTPLHILSHESPFGTGIVETAAQQGVSSVQWSHNGLFLVSGGEDYLVRVWDIRLGAPLINTLSGHGGPVSSVAISPDDSLIASGGDETQVILYSENPMTKFHLK